MVVKAVFHDGRFEPVDKQPEIPENETVMLEVCPPNRIQLRPMRWNDPVMLAARKAFASLPPLDIEKEVQWEREQS
jgi:hypothetical protein